MGKVLQLHSIDASNSCSVQSILSTTGHILWQLFIKPFEDAQFEIERENLKKVRYLEQEAYKEFFTQFLEYHKNRIGDSVDIAAWKYADRDAMFYAKKCVSVVVANKKLDKCYKARIKEQERV